jgi:hypothetical protein
MVKKTWMCFSFSLKIKNDKINHNLSIFVNNALSTGVSEMWGRPGMSSYWHITLCPCKDKMESTSTRLPQLLSTAYLLDANTLWFMFLAFCLKRVNICRGVVSRGKLAAQGVWV